MRYTSIAYKGNSRRKQKASQRELQGNSLHSTQDLSIKASAQFHFTGHFSNNLVLAAADPGDPNALSLALFSWQQWTLSPNPNPDPNPNPKPASNPKPVLPACCLSLILIRARLHLCRPRFCPVAATLTCTARIWVQILVKHTRLGRACRGQMGVRGSGGGFE